MGTKAISYAICIAFVIIFVPMGKKCPKIQRMRDCQQSKAVVGLQISKRWGHV